MAGQYKISYKDLIGTVKNYDILTTENEVYGRILRGEKRYETEPIDSKTFKDRIKSDCYKQYEPIWEGRSSELYDKLSNMANDSDLLGDKYEGSNFPNSINHFTRQLDELRPVLKYYGITCNVDRNSSNLSYVTVYNNNAKPKNKKERTVEQSTAVAKLEKELEDFVPEKEDIEEIKRMPWIWIGEELMQVTLHY